MYWYVVTILALLAVGATEVQGEKEILGALHWCDTLCLCLDATSEKVHCFSDHDIYSLLQVDRRKVQRLTKIEFDFQNTLTWCSERCVCHKESRNEFKCTDHANLRAFITDKQPDLVQYLAPEAVEEEGEAELILPPTEGGVEEAERRDRHDRKKNRKHRRNKKKNHGKKEAMEGDHQPLVTPMTPLTTVTPSSPPQEMTTEPAERTVLVANILPQASTGRGIPSSSSKGGENPELEVPRERKTVAGEVSSDLEALRANVDQIKADVALNQCILLVTVAVSAVAMIGVLILAFCVRRSSRGLSKCKRNTSVHQEDNNVTKANLDEAW